MPEEMTAATADGEQMETQATEQVETGDTGQVTDSQTETNQQEQEQEQQTEQQAPPERTFTQSQLDEIVQKRIAKEQTRLDNERKTTYQEARDTWIAEQGYEWKGRLIKTEAEYRAALQEQELEGKIRAQYSSLPDEIVNEILDNRKFREETLAEKKSREEADRKAQAEQDFVSRRNSMYEEYLTEFPDHDLQSIPIEVFAEADKWLKSGGREGRRLADALTRHNWQQSIAQQKAEAANQANADASTGSVKTQGIPKGSLTEEMFENMTPQEAAKRWPEVKKLFKLK